MSFAEQECRVKENMYRKALETLNDVVLYLDVGTQKIATDEAKFAAFFHAPVPDFFSGAMIVPLEEIHPDDRPILYGVRHSIQPMTAPRLQSGQSPETASQQFEFRLRRSPYRYEWVRMVLVSLLSPPKDAYIICFKNIADEKKRSLALLEEVQRDSGTQLYNKKHTHSAIRRAILRDKCGALFLIDIDDFKGINDRVGHLSGDKVILSVAERLRGLFGAAGSIVGRVGGDEFMCYLPFSAESEVRSKARAILTEIRSVRYGKAGQGAITASVGVALHPRDATDFERLFSAADLAAYYSKTAGKNRYSLYDGNKMSWENMRYAGAAQPGETPQFYADSFLRFVGRVLREDGVPIPVEDVLQEVSRRFAAQSGFAARFGTGRSRVYTVDGSSGDFAPWRALFADEANFRRFAQGGAVSCGDAAAEDGEIRAACRAAQIRSFVCCGVNYRGKTVGSVGFAGQNLLSAEELSVLGFVCRLTAQRVAKAFALSGKKTVSCCRFLPQKGSCGARYGKAIRFREHSPRIKQE